MCCLATGLEWLWSVLVTIITSQAGNTKYFYFLQILNADD